ncbi:MAG: shikimate dehydrogenase [Bacteroidetes bacterium]|nr:shikimate dehydrogenase [Bacteroidota bacterium]
MNLYGLTGYPLDHSFSKALFQEKFSEENISAFYDLFPLQDVSGIRELFLKTPSLEGLNVTMPFKTAVIPFLDALDAIALQTGAVNTVKVYREKTGLFLKGFNTDAYGFEKSFAGFYKNEGGHALVLGSGASSRTVQYVLNKMSIFSRIVTRHPANKEQLHYSQTDKKILEKYNIIINTTPLGMVPEISNCPPIAYEWLNTDHFLFDLIYNPAETLFLKKGKEAGAHTENGMEMLLLQAVESWRIWQEA